MWPRFLLILRKFASSGWGPVLLFALLGLGIGFALAGDYGLSWDEYLHEVYAEQTLEIYAHERAPQHTLTDLRFYGPFYSLLAWIAKPLLLAIRPGWGSADAGHFSYYLSFLVAVFSLYSLANRFTGKLAALGATFLFASQPLLFGHAFINPKDTPFMAFFLATVSLGFHAVDRLSKPVPQHREGNKGEVKSPSRWGIPGMCRDWKASRRHQRVIFSVALCFFLLSVLDLFVFHRTLRFAKEGLSEAYRGTGPRVLVTLFQWIAQDAWKTPLDLYMDKLTETYMWARFPLVVGLASLPLLASSMVFNLRPVWVRLSKRRAWLDLALAAVVLGLCASIRVVGPFAGAMVSVLYLVKDRRRALPALSVYWGIAAVTTYLTWPFLWTDPIRRFTESLVNMLHFSWSGTVLYQGSLTPADQIPWHFLPFLFLVQFTLPAVLLGLFGFSLALRKTFRSFQENVDLAMVLCWMALPFLGKVILGTSFYDNFRQLLFLVPPIFVCGAIGLQAVLLLWKSAGWRILVLTIAILPGVHAVVRYHPYEYIYYNEIVGGVGGAFRKFELDYWCTSYREAIEHVNAIAPRDAVVGVQSARHLIVPYAREDLSIKTIRSQGEANDSPADLILVCTRSNADLRSYPDLNVIWQVSRGEAVLVVVGTLDGGGTSSPNSTTSRGSP